MDFMSHLDSNGRPPKNFMSLDEMVRHRPKTKSSSHKNSTWKRIKPLLTNPITLTDLHEQTGVNINTLRGIMSQKYSVGLIRKAGKHRLRTYQLDQ